MNELKIDLKKNIVFWLTGLSGSGKTTISESILKLIQNKNIKVLDGDIIRKGLCCDLSFSDEDRKENIIERMVRLVAQTKDIQLTNRQAEVALLILKGHSTTSIGLRLGISSQTVKVFRKQLYKRCDVSSQAELFGLMFPLLSAQSDPLVF